MALPPRARSLFSGCTEDDSDASYRPDATRVDRDRGMARIGCRSGGGTVGQLAVPQMLRESVLLALERVDAFARVRMGHRRFKTAESADPGVVRRTSLGHCALDGDPERCDERGSRSEICIRLTARPISGCTVLHTSLTRKGTLGVLSSGSMVLFKGQAFSPNPGLRAVAGSSPTSSARRLRQFGASRRLRRKPQGPTASSPRRWQRSWC